MQRQFKSKSNGDRIKIFQVQYVFNTRSQFQQNTKKNYKICQKCEQFTDFDFQTTKIFSYTSTYKIFRFQEDNPQDMKWPYKPKCYSQHIIYAVDRSGSMNSYGSWTRAMDFLTSQSNPSGNYRSLFSFSIWGWPAGPIENYYTHVLNAALPYTPMSGPSGGANFDHALSRAGQILGYNFPHPTCLYLISDGWTGHTKAAVNNWNDAINSFRFRTGCSVCVKCYLTMRSKWGQTPMEKLCKELGAPVIQLERSKDIYEYSTMRTMEGTTESQPPIDPQDPVDPVKPDGGPSRN